MKVLLISNIFGNGGKETHCYHLSSHLVQQGAEVILWPRSLNKESNIFLDKKKIGLKFLTHPLSGIAGPNKIKTILELLLLSIWRLKGFDYIYSTEISKLTPLIRSLLLKRGGSFIWNPAGSPIDIADHYERLGKSLHNGKIIDQIVVETETHKTKMKGTPSSSAKIAVIPHLSNIPHSLKTPKTSSDQFRISFLGRFDHNKGPLNLLEVFKLIALPYCHLSYYGYGHLKENLLQEILNAGLSEKVTVHSGWSTPDELQAIFSETDLVGLLSKSEGLPLVLLECLASGTPFFAFNVGSIHELEIPGWNKIIPVSGNEETAIELKNFIAEIKSVQPSPQKAIDYFEKNYSRPVLIKKYLALLKLNATD